MRICIVHNEYGKFSGEEAYVQNLSTLLKTNGHEIVSFNRTSTEIEGSCIGSIRAFFSGISNPASRNAFSQMLQESKPDVVHINNVFPLISPSILPVCRKAGVPMVMTLHNYRLICPNALLQRKGVTCRECLGGHEWQCVKHNCENSFFKSLGYALRTRTARKHRSFLDNINTFICLSTFQREIHIKEGFPAGQCIVTPNFLADSIESGEPASKGDFVLYAGRVTPERDIPALIEAARQLPEVPVKIAGAYWRMPDLPGTAPGNVEFLGEVDKQKLEALYRNSRLVVLPTGCYEGFPTVLLEAMAYSRPIVCTNIGGLPEIVIDGSTGLLYESDDSLDLAARISQLWNNPGLCDRLGQSGRERLDKEYSKEIFYSKMMDIYASVVNSTTGADN